MTDATDIQDGSPPTLDHLIGQTRAVRQLKTALEAHFADRADTSGGEAPPLAHTLLVGPAGVGKSLIAQIVARELGVEAHQELGQNLWHPSELHGLLALAEPHEVIFLDELHEASPQCQTALYRALEERILFLPGGPRGTAQRIDLPPFTFLAATTDEWRLTKPLRDRFRLVARLQHYSTEELSQLLAQRASRLGWSVTDAALRDIARRSRGTPRHAVTLLEATRRTARAVGANSINVHHVRRMTDIEGIDTRGLGPKAQEYLRILAEAKGPVRLNVVATHLGLPQQTIQQIFEMDLLRLGLIYKTDQGRELTPEGRRHVRSLQ